MIEHIAVRSWQALRKVDLDLGRFTVIVGPSSSGKSGLMRAFKAVASNVRGTGNITRGQKSCAISVRTGDAAITLERGDTASSYSLEQQGQVTTYTKLAGSVPPQITEALRIEPVPSGGTSINFAGQFDKPYLLDESGATVARELGELTNVNIIFEAVRSANKKRAMFATALKNRESDLAELTRRSAEFADLPTKLAAMDWADTYADMAQQLSDRVNRLRDAIDRLQLAEQVLARAQVPDVPDISPLMQIVRVRTVLLDLLSQLDDADTTAAEYAEQVTCCDDEEMSWSFKLGDTLRTLGECPLCGQRQH